MSIRTYRAKAKSTADDDGYIAGYRRITWGGGLLNVYSVASTRTYFTLTWASLYDTPEQARTQVDALKAYDRRALNEEIDAIIAELQLPVAGVNIISVDDADGGGLGDYAAGKEYGLSGSSAILDGREIRFVSGRTAIRTVVIGVFGKTTSESALELARIAESNIEPFLLTR